MFTKRGERVPEEATALAEARHPGVVELVDSAGDVLRTRMVSGRSLADIGPIPAAEVAGVAAAVAATLADLHDLVVVHGGIDASHVLVTADGRPMLCSLGRGGDPADDVAALGRLVTDLLAKAPPEHRRGSTPVRSGRRRRLGPMLAPPVTPALAALAEKAMAAEPGERPTARAFADTIRQRIPAARLPGATLPRSPERRLSGAALRSGGRNRRIATGSAAKVASLLIGVTLAGTWALSRHSAPANGGAAANKKSEAATASGRGNCSPACGSADPSTPETTHGSMSSDPVPATPDPPGAPATRAPMAKQVWPVEPLDLRDGVVTYRGSRYVVGDPGDSLVAGDWDCTGEPTLALLRFSAGEVFAFDGWPHARETLTARRLGRVEDAAEIRAVDIDGDGCHELEVQRQSAPPVRLRVRQ